MSRPGRVVPRYLGAVTSGLLLWAAFPPLDQGLLAWVALIPLLWSIRAASPRDAFAQGYVTGLVWFGLTLSWITLFGLVTWALLVLILALYIGAFAGLFRWLAERYGGWDLLLVPLVWTAVEFARSTGPLGFPWALLGVSQYHILPVLQLAALGGVHVISFLIALTNASVVALLRLRGVRPRPIEVTGLLVTAVLLAGGIAYGVGRLQTLLPDARSVAVLQPNISPFAKGDVGTHQSQLAEMERLTREARGRGANLIVFPESAIPINLLGPGGAAGNVASWAPDRVIVASSFEATPDGVRNTAVVLEGGRVRGTYAKRRLVPFGEAGVTPGGTYRPIATRAGTVGVAICYESAFAEIARQEAQGGADLLLVLTNDGWFGTSAGPPQHAAYTPLRAVENGRAIARAANTGISMIVDPLGRVKGRLDLERQGVLLAKIPRAISTPYLRGGWLFAPAALVALGVLVLPPATRAVRTWWPDPAFVRLLRTIIWPGLFAALGASILNQGPAWRPAVSVGVLVAAAVSAGGWQHLGIQPRRVFLSTSLGLAVVIGLGAVMVSAYTQYGFSPSLQPPPGGWLLGGGAVLVGALSWELWLRGAVFTAAQDWRGPGAALLLSTLPALAIAPGVSSEVRIWSLFVGLVFGGIRLVAGDALGLAIPRAAGLLVLGAVTVLR